MSHQITESIHAVAMESNDTVRVAVRIRPLSDYEIIQDSSQCVTADPNGKQVKLIFLFDESINKHFLMIFQRAHDDLRIARFVEQ